MTVKRMLAAWLRDLANRLDPPPRIVLNISPPPPGTEERIEAAFREELRRVRQRGWFI
ncbi:hypothetical protein ACFFMN_33875 [Planobispora siamensis]|uniref:Uncharacterized protein n=1 Tax=Planobispora siamensis TaxID=936338 RepID=A0A8J3SH40_9ACTN|nr:hypothetical protein [Planobispora siamensis]GIH91959.1 hypothetical protein Psi01_25890 [Planobispora siamensis]